MRKKTEPKLPIVIQGKFPKSFITGDENDKDKLIEQIHIITYVKPKDK